MQTSSHVLQFRARFLETKREQILFHRPYANLGAPTSPAEKHTQHPANHTAVVISLIIPHNFMMSKTGESVRRRKGMANAFTLAEVSGIVNISSHMLNYLARHGYLIPFYGEGVRGVRRYYSYRDLAVACVISKLLTAGLEISRLKSAIASLAKEAGWLKPGHLEMLVTDGTKLQRFDAGRLLSDITPKGQSAFAFVISVSAVRSEISARMDGQRLAHFDHQNRSLKAQ